MKALRILAALALALPLSTATARPAAQGGSPDFDGNGVVNDADLSAFVRAWAAAVNFTPTPPAVPTVAPSATSTAVPATSTRTATPVPPTATATATPQPVTAQRMIVVVLENRALTTVQAHPYFQSLAARGRLLTDYRTISNPSQPNYVAMNFGDTMGVVDNSVIDIPGRNIVDLLEEAGVSWKTYHEHYPGNCWPGYRIGGVSGIAYARKHNAFISSDTVRNNANRCAKIVDHLAFEADVAAGTVPRYSVFVPDKDNSSHDTSVDFAANWLSGWLEPKLANPTLADVLWVITWDEAEIDGPIPISTILIGPGITPGSVDGATYSHYSLLRTTQAFFGLGSLGRNDATAPLIPLGGGALPTPTATSPPATPTPTRTPTATFLPLVTNTPTRTPTPTATRTPGGSSMAFGDVSVINDFTQADGALPSEWTTDALSDAAAALRVVSNTVAAASGGGYSSARRNDVTYSGNKQAYITISTLPESPRYASIGFVMNPGAGTADGYFVEYRVGTGLRLFRVDNSVATALGATGSWTPSAGDKLGIRIDETNGVIEAWTHTGSTWTQQFTRSDSTYTGAMYPFVYLRGSNTRCDDFAAGSESAPVSVSPGPATAVAASVAPTVVLGSVSISPAAASVVAASVAPTVVAGSISFTPSVVTITTASVAPTVVTGPVSVTPAAATAVAASVAPAVVQSSQTVAPAAATAVAASVAPTTVAGSLSLAPSPATAVIATVAPSVVAGSVSVAPAASTVVVASVAPTVQTGGVDVAPAAASAVIASVAPSVVLGSQSLAPAAASAVIATVAPTVSAGGNLTLAPSPVTVVAASVAPSVVAGSVSVTPAAASAVTGTQTPTVVAGSLLLAPASVSAVAGSVAPSVILGNVSVTAPAATAVILTTGPTVVSGSTVAAPAAASVVILTLAPDVPTSGAVVTPAAARMVVEVGQPLVNATVGEAIDHPGRPGAGLRIGGGVSVRSTARVGARAGGRTRVR